MKHIITQINPTTKCSAMYVYTSISLENTVNFFMKILLIAT